MNTFHNFVLTKAVFNEELSEAILSKNEEEIIQIVESEYAAELNEPELFHIEIEKLDVVKLYMDHTEQLNDEQYLNGFL